MPPSLCWWKVRAVWNTTTRGCTICGRDGGGRFHCWWSGRCLWRCIHLNPQSLAIFARPSLTVVQSELLLAPTTQGARKGGSKRDKRRSLPGKYANHALAQFRVRPCRQSTFSSLGGKGPAPSTLGRHGQGRHCVYRKRHQDDR